MRAHYLKKSDRAVWSVSIDCKVKGCAVCVCRLVVAGCSGRYPLEPWPRKAHVHSYDLAAGLGGRVTDTVTTNPRYDLKMIPSRPTIRS